MPAENLFIVISLNHTYRRHKAITLWRSDDKGYCWKLESAGRYDEARVLEHLGYYNSGCSNIAALLSLIEKLACEVEYDTKEFGICLPNYASTWKQLIAATIRPPQYQPEPEHRGARRQKTAA
ncbi:hypothetical protein FXN65_10600 [Metapseudomonas lalkuanensis]|uniref:Uncharacterized protein n=1 Tax=Metapseudomonas lalkuanensis TaxID=2604832 RepID=A0A5J6QJC6_9GAMM|nr:hypothetical protein [Pseudomonas lalkuanensis]QEY62503.1 hypothetical protein FXN65_10600 [Pseudomonas lalkuanensis]